MGAVHTRRHFCSIAANFASKNGFDPPNFLHQYTSSLRRMGKYHLPGRMRSKLVVKERCNQFAKTLFIQVIIPARSSLLLPIQIHKVQLSWSSPSNTYKNRRKASYGNSDYTKQPVQSLHTTPPAHAQAQLPFPR